MVCWQQWMKKYFLLMRSSQSYIHIIHINSVSLRPRQEGCLPWPFCFRKPHSAFSCVWPVPSLWGGAFGWSGTCNHQSLLPLLDCIGPGILCTLLFPECTCWTLPLMCTLLAPKAGSGQLFAVVIGGAAICITGLVIDMCTSEAIAMRKKVCAKG